MEKILIYGAGQGGIHLYEEILSAGESYELQAFVDRYSKDKFISMHNGLCIGGVQIIRPEQIPHYTFDKIFIAVDDTGVKNTLMELYNIPEEKINTKKYQNGIANSVRLKALEHFKELCDQFCLEGSVAEVGVFQGDFAKHINRIFPKSELYLYDTFEGFKSSDLDKEVPESAMRSYEHYSMTTEELVLEKMTHKDKVHILKGLFPDTAVGEDDKYIFVNLDADLYAPILAGLKFFFPRMVPGGVIFIHDYFNPNCPGVKQAIEEFRKKVNIGIVPLGDYLTVSIPKPLL